jgi:hypothetical protein
VWFKAKFASHQPWLNHNRFRAVKQAELELFDVVLWQSRIDHAKAKVRLNWGSPETPELVPADLIHAAQIGLVRPEEFRKNAVKFGWELWETKSSTA